MQLLSRDNTQYTFDPAHQPCMKVELGERFRVETHDSRGGRMKTLADYRSTAPDLSQPIPKMNPSTGPIAIKDVHAGDTIKITIHSITIEQGARGYVVFIPGFGVIKDVSSEPTAIFGELKGERIEMETGLSIPLRPHIGTIGVTPTNITPTSLSGTYGGNMDCRFVEAGTELYLPVYMEQALLLVGDVHGSMGAGELMTSGIEMPATVELSVEKVQGVKINGPLLRKGDELWTIATAPEFQDALNLASADMLQFLQDYAGVSRTNAAAMITSVCDAQICQSNDRLFPSIIALSVHKDFVPLFKG